MSAAKANRSGPAAAAARLRAMTPAERAALAERLGLTLDGDLPVEAAVERLLAREALIARLDRDVLLELLKWGGRPVAATAAKEEMVREAGAVSKMSFTGLSRPALAALAELRGVRVDGDAGAEAIIRALKESESLLAKFNRKRRRLVGKLVARLVGESTPPANNGQAGEPAGPSLKEQIEQRGLVGGLADKLRGAADEYMALKLDEIEMRIDRKLDEIDRRLAEWRDREIANRLRIIKITLLASIGVALISVLYAWIKKNFGL